MSNTEWHDDAGEKHTEIAPLDLDFSAIDETSFDEHMAAGEASPNNKFLIPLVALLGLVAVAVIVVPLLQKSTVTEPANAPEETLVQETDDKQIDEGTPFQEAELAKLRKAAQDTLEQLLEKRLWLEKRNVQLWAAEAFHRSAELAGEGDEKYRGQQFKAANQLYSEGLDIVTGLLDGVPQIIESALQRGDVAIQNNQPQEADEAFKLVQAIEPDHAKAAEGLLRLSVLQPVNEALVSAEQYEQQQDYEQTLQALATVLELDPVRAPGLQPRIDRLESTLLEQRFSEQMSLGFRNLDEGRQQLASQHFSKARELKPNDAAPGKALRMVRNQQSLSRMSVHLERAQGFEREEQWAQAVQQYDLALKVDANLSDAAQRREVASRRMKMDQALQTLNDDPLRLASPQLYQKGVKIHSAAQRVANPGPRLRRQVDLLGDQLTASRESLPVVIQSDGATQVTVQQIAQLGSVQERRLNLIPGRYVALGSRDGYRDVRREFVVQQGARNVKVDVRCVEPI